MPDDPSHESVGLRLIRGDEDAWTHIFKNIFPRAREMIHRKFGPDKRWWSADDAGLDSALRTTFRRLKEGLRNEELNSWEDLCRLLVAVASNKIIDSLRKAEREGKLVAKAEQAELKKAKDSAVLEEIFVVEGDQAMQDALAKLDNALEDAAERSSSEEKVEGLKEREIAERIEAETGERMTGYMVRELWKAIRARFNRRFPELRGESFPR